MQWDNAAPGGGRPRMRRRPGRRKMVARGRGGGGGRRGEQTFSRIHIFSRSLDFCASIISRTFFCSTIFTRSKHFLHPHFCKDFHAYISITRSITFPASVFLQEARIFYSQWAKKKAFWWNCVWNMWSQAEFFSCRKFLRQYCCHWKFTILYQERLTGSLNMIRD